MAGWALCSAVALLVGCRPPAAASTPDATVAAGPSPIASPTPAATAADAAAASPTPTAAAPAAEPYRNTLRWSTASELENFGYDVYRGTDPDGPFERITKDPILGAGTTDEVSRYDFVDEAIDPHTTYYYYVESISLAGVRERFTPVVKKAPKLPPPEEGSDPKPAATP